MLINNKTTTKNTFFNVFILIVNSLIVVCMPTEKYVLDTTAFQGELNWDKQAFGDSIEPPGWKEQSFSQRNGDVWRVHFVCDISSSNPNNWLRTPYIHKGEANRFIIRLEYTIRECKKYPSVIRSCKETFQLLYAETDGTQMVPEFNEANYKFLKTIAPNQQQQLQQTTLSPGQSNIYRTEVDLALTKKGVYFVFRDQGACVSILSVKILYTVCPSKLQNLVIYPKTPTGANVTDLVQRTGYCIDNAESKQTPIAYCQANGNWFITNDNGDNSVCMCKAGYYYEPNSTQCLACPQGTYKSDVSNSECLPCPENSWSPSNGYKYCTCNDGYYRPNANQYNSSCILMPTEPKNLTVFYVDQATVKLRWNSIGNYAANTVQYVVDCYKCIEETGDNELLIDNESSSSSSTTSCKYKIRCESYVKYEPERNKIFTSQVIIKSLDSNQQYLFEIYAQHVNNLFKTRTVDITIRTSMPIYNSEFENILNASCVYYYDTNEYYLMWKVMNMTKEVILGYEIKYWPLNEYDQAKILSINNSKQTNYTFKYLKLNTIYTFQIRLQTNDGWTAYTSSFDSIKYGAGSGGSTMSSSYVPTQHILFQSTGYTLSQTNQFIDDYVKHGNAGNSFSIYVAFAVAGSLCFVVGTLTIVILLTRNKKFCFAVKNKTVVGGSGNSSSSNSDCDSIDFAKRNANLGYNQFSGSSGGSSPMWPPAMTGTMSKTYIDPHTYEDPTKAVNEFAKELSPSNIIIESVIGGGEFGDVCKGYLKHSTWCQTTVAIKTLKNAATEQNRCDFLTEASIMAQFKDPNVIHLEGVVTKSLPLMIVTEYMENGSLDTFLRLNESKLQMPQLIKMLRDVASGMKYLSEMNFIHRDLAARNILVNKDCVCKVADFGLSREIENDATDGAYTTKGGKIPIRWTAPEAIVYRRFTCASDVWSYGILSWEVLSYGERPYWNWSNQDVMKAVEKGYRLPTPQNCPEFMYELLLKCWKAERTERPRFAEIVQMLDYLLKNDSEIEKKAKLREILAINPNKPTYIQLTSTKEFLQQTKLEQYQENFEKHSLNNLSSLFYLEQRDIMCKLGIIKPNDCKIIVDSLQSIKAHFSYYYSNNSNTIHNSNTLNYGKTVTSTTTTAAALDALTANFYLTNQQQRLTNTTNTLHQSQLSILQLLGKAQINQQQHQTLNHHHQLNHQHQSQPQQQQIANNDNLLLYVSNSSSSTTGASSTNSHGYLV